MVPELRSDPKREELHEIFCEILGSRYVYFQPPNNLQLVYPCIIYNRSTADSKFANNGLYLYTKRYEVTVIDQDPNSGIPDKVAALNLCSHERWFAVDNLNHDVFNLFF